jgi:hypothetical protein
MRNRVAFQVHGESASNSANGTVEAEGDDVRGVVGAFIGQPSRVMGARMNKTSMRRDLIFNCVSPSGLVKKGSHVPTTFHTYACPKMTFKRIILR